MSDHCCALGLLALLAGLGVVSSWLVWLHVQVDREVDGLLSSLRSVHCDSKLQSEMEYSTGGVLLRIANVTNPRDCNERCRGLPACAAWTWGSRRATADLAGACLLRELEPGTMPGVRSRTGVVSGLACQEGEAPGGLLRGASAARALQQPPAAPGSASNTEAEAAGRTVPLRSALVTSSSRLAPADAAAAARGGAAAREAGGAVQGLDSSTPEAGMPSTSAATTTATPATTSPAPALAAEQTLFCFSLMLPGSYEQELLRTQYGEAASIFACDGYAVYSNRTINISGALTTSVVDSSLHCELGGEFHTAMNTAIFMAVWEKVSKDAEYLKFMWTVKVDPDTVFFPARLRTVLTSHQPEDHFRKAAHDAHGSAVDALRCDVWGDVGDGSCADTFEWPVGEKTLHECGVECARYSNCKGMAWSEEQGCVVLGALADSAGASPGWQQFERVRPKGVYINNCKYGLHGPIEILSSAAVTELVRGRERCAKHFNRECGGECAWGEDLFIDQCLWKVMGVERHDVLDVLLEAHCDPPDGWDDCSQEGQVAFHPFKSVEAYRLCSDRALRLSDLLPQAAAVPGNQAHALA